MQYIPCSLLVFITTFCAPLRAQNVAHSQYFGDGYQLVWADEFNKDGSPNPENWTYEQGFVRNEELQWYQPENAFCKNGSLVIEARKTEKPNPDYVPESKNWRKNRKSIHYTSACLITKGLKSWQYGRFEMRAKIDISKGLWPAFWTLGVEGAWPANGEIDIMEYYRGKILANIASTARDGKTKWFSQTKAVDELGGKAWAKKFHIWRMDWDEQSISLFMDNVLLNKTSCSDLDNDDRKGIHPFKQKHYILLDLAIGGMNGGDPKGTKFPNRFEIDYVRVYQK
ncbi:family 16 glycosylhydrolase [Pedobacter petrophilus]|uniref:Family 16 glycosylhydrolase n=2 Tax=Pedobacter petrophilus TaxID=1908241 RepID=A0A7K0FTA9_9SPHI|nr:family 16 glycosylhydrolase [Pedobacter petrophilus]